MTKNKQRPITIFSVLALLTLMAGGTITLATKWLHMEQWKASGEFLSVGQSNQIHFEPGMCIITFESKEAIPTIREAVHLYVSGPNDEHMRAEWIAQMGNIANDYTPHTIAALARTEYQGRPLWRFDAPTAGWYTLRATNDHDEQNAESDRIVANRFPATFVEARNVNNAITIAAASITGVLVIGLYIVHFMALSRRSRESAAPNALAGWRADN